MIFIDFDDTITKEVKYESFFQHWDEKLEQPVKDDNFKKVLEKNKFVVVTNSLKIEKFLIKSFLSRVGLLNNCIDILCVNNFIFYKIMNHEEIIEKKTNIIIKYIKKHFKDFKVMDLIDIQYIDSDVNQAYHINKNLKQRLIIDKYNNEIIDIEQILIPPTIKV